MLFKNLIQVINDETKVIIKAKNELNVVYSGVKKYMPSEHLSVYGGHTVFNVELVNTNILIEIEK